MEFKVAHSDLLQGALPGALVAFEFVERDQGEWVITAARPWQSHGQSSRRSQLISGKICFAKIIDWSGETVSRRWRPVRHCWRCLCRAQNTAGCAAGPVRRSGHRLHRVSGPGPAGGRGSGHVSVDHLHAVGSQVQGGAGFSFFGARSSTSSSRMALTSTGPLARALNTSTSRRGACPRA